jgi:hypothetical protein
MIHSKVFSSQAAARESEARRLQTRAEALRNEGNRMAERANQAVGNLPVTPPDDARSAAVFATTAVQLHARAEDTDAEAGRHLDRAARLRTMARWARGAGMIAAVIGALAGVGGVWLMLGPGLPKASANR